MKIYFNDDAGAFWSIMQWLGFSFELKSSVLVCFQLRKNKPNA